MATDVGTETGQARRPAAGAFRAMKWTLLVNVAAPFLLYEFMTSHGSSELTALAVGSLFPLAGIGVTAIRTRRLDWIALITLASILVSLIAGLLFVSPRFLLLKDSVITATIGLVFLLSLGARRPLLVILARQTMATDPAAQEAFERRLAMPQVRRRIRRMTAVWGLALVGEAAVRAVLSFLVTPGVLMLLSPLLAAAVFGSLAVWSIRARRRAHA